MANYELAFNVNGNAVSAMLKIEESAKKMSDTVTKEGKKISDSVEEMSKKLDHFKERVIEAFAIREVFEFGRELMNLTAEFEGFENRIKFASVDTVDAGQNLAFLREEAERLHLPLRQVYEGFSEMEAGLRGTGIEGERLRTLFDGISTAAATLHLPTYQLQRTLYDLKEIGEIGLNARIMRSLNVALPGIGPLIQKTFGKGWKELQKEGISGPDFLNKLGPALQQNFASGLGQYAESLQAKMTDMQNKFIQKQLELGDKLKPVFIEILSAVNGALDKIGGFVEYLSQHANAIKTFAMTMGILVVETVAYKGAIQAVAALEKVGAFIRGVYTLATVDAAKATAALSAEMSTTVLGAFAVGIALIVSAMIKYNAEIDAAAEKLTGLKALAGGFNTTEQGFTDTRGEMHGIVTMTDEQRGRVFDEITKKRKDAQDFLDMHVVGMLGNAEFNVNEAGKGLRFTPSGELLSASGQDQINIDNGKYEIYKQALDNLNQIKGEYNRIHGIIGNYGSDLNRIDALGYTKPVYSTSGDAAGESATHTTHLAGAEGGLGHAKTINIKIDRVMTVENHDNKNLVHHAEQAADFIIRTANNYAESQAGTQ